MLGLDNDGKPHATWFSEEDAAVAAKAAQMMQFHAVRVTGDDLRKAAGQLPIGKIFASGRAFAPFVKRELYDKFSALIGTDAEVKPQPEAESQVEPAPKAAVPETASGQNKASPNAGDGSDAWAAIKVGALVLARDPDPENGWYEALVTQVSADGNTLTVRWRDYSDAPQVQVKRQGVGLLRSPR